MSAFCILSSTSFPQRQWTYLPDICVATHDPLQQLDMRHSFLLLCQVQGMQKSPDDSLVEKGRVHVISKLTFLS